MTRSKNYTWSQGLHGKGKHASTKIAERVIKLLLPTIRLFYLLFAKFFRTRIFTCKFRKMDTLYRKVEEALDTIRPYLEADGGNVEIVEITSDQTLRIELKGTCKTCNMSHMTMKSGIEETIKNAVPEIRHIISVN
jgi:Fe-S cluster biogenesis protein NfuA